MFIASSVTGVTLVSETATIRFPEELGRIWIGMFGMPENNDMEMEWPAINDKRLLGGTL